MTSELPVLDRALVEELRRSAGATVDLPSPALFDLPEKVVQFGTGAFLRGFVEYFIDAANRRGAFAGRVVAIASTESGGGRHDAFARQDGLYTLVTRGQGDGRQRVIASMSRAIAAASWNDVLACAHNPGLEVVFSNTTEVGIVFDATDTADASPPRSFPGKLTRFLWERACHFGFDVARGLVVVPCELIEDNGDQLRAAVVATARHWRLDSQFLRWLDACVPFCNSLVDRIVPSFGDDLERRRVEDTLGYRDALLTLCEPYRLFAIEANASTRRRLGFADGDPSIVRCDDVRPYRARKLHLLNAPHSILACIGLLAKCRYVHEAMAAEPGAAIRRAMLEEIAPYLDVPGADAYAHDVIARFTNPAIHHPLLDIMLQATTKMRVRVVPCIASFVHATQTPPPVLTLGFAALLLSLRDIEDIASSLRRPVPADDNSVLIRRAWTAHGDDFERVVHDVASDRTLWQRDLTELPGFATLAAELLSTLATRGVSAALERVRSGPGMATLRG